MISFNQLSSKQKKIAIFVAILLLLLLVRSCGSSNHTSSSNNGDSIPLNMLLAAGNKNATDDNKFYMDGNTNEYVNKSGFSIHSISNRKDVPMGIIYICNQDIDQAKLQEEFLQLVAIIQNKKKISDKDGKQLIDDLHLSDTSDSTLYQAKLDKYHFEKIAYNSINIGNVSGLQIPVTIIHFYPDGEKDTIQNDAGKALSFENYVKKTVTNRVCRLDRQHYFYDDDHKKESKIQPIQ